MPDQTNTVTTSGDATERLARLEGIIPTLVSGQSSLTNDVRELARSVNMAIERTHAEIRNLSTSIESKMDAAAVEHSKTFESIRQSFTRDTHERTKGLIPNIVGVISIALTIVVVYISAQTNPLTARVAADESINAERHTTSTTNYHRIEDRLQSVMEQATRTDERLKTIQSIITGTTGVKQP